MIVFSIDVAASIVMGRKFMKTHKEKNGKPCKPIARLVMYLGATMGILLWSYIIGLIIYATTQNIHHLLNAAFVGTTTSILPCILGIVQALNITKKCDTKRCAYCDIK
jgi:hypothetical protein